MADRGSPLAHFPDGGAEGRRVTLREVQPDSILQVQAWPASLATVQSLLAELFGEAAPPAGRATSLDAFFLGAIGAGRFLMAGDADLAGRLARLLPAGEAAVVELSHGRTILRIEGAEAPDVLARCVAIDVDASAFPPGRLAQTMIHHIDVLLHRRGGDVFDLWVGRSFAAALAEWLVDAGAEFGLGLVRRDRRRGRA
jgi:sarcosine oxidase subunit gamma